jgi:hypothetical protein
MLLGDYLTSGKEQIAGGAGKSAEQIVPREDRDIEDGPQDEYSPSDVQRARMEEELRQIFGMIADEDVDGILAMLESGELTSQIVAAGYLAKVGEARAIGPLGRLSEQWYGRDEGNVFVMALQQIAEQLAEPQAEAEEVPKPAETKPKPRLAEFVPKGVLCGLITDIETGEPVVGAKLKISKGRIFHSVTDPNGFYYLDDISEDGNYRVEVSSLEYLWVSKWSEIPVVALTKSGRAVKHFKLRRGCQVDVDVVDEQGEPIKDADVSITWMGQKYGRETEVGRRFERTDGTGRTIVGAVEPSEIAYLITVRHEDFAYAKDIIKLTEPDVVEYAEIVMQKGADVKGYAEYSDGMPAAGLRVYAQPDWWNINVVPGIVDIEEDGSFTLGHITAGAYTVYVSIPNPGGGSMSKQVLQTKLPLADGLLVVTVPQKAPTGDVDKEPSYTAEETKPVLKGTVLKAGTNEAVKSFKARVRKLRNLDANVYSVQPDRWYEFSVATGAFQIEVNDAGVYQVQIAADGFAWVWSEEINTDENEPVTVLLTAGGAIRGHVVNGAGKAISGAKVIPLSRARGNMPYTANVFGSDSGATETVEGKFLLQNIEAGEETIKVTHPDYGPVIVEGIAVVEGRTTGDIEFVLTRGGIVEGYVYDAQGAGRANVTLYFQDAGGYMMGEKLGRLASAVTDNKGFYRVEGLPEQVCYVKRTEEYKHLGVVCRTVMPISNKTTRLDFGGQPVITGRIMIDEDPLGGTKVLLADAYDKGGRVYQCFDMTDAGGNFIFTGAPAGVYGIYYQLPQDPRYTAKQWQRIAVVDIGIEDIHLGTVGIRTGSVAVSVDGGDPNEPLDGLTVYVQKDVDTWGAWLGKVNKPEQAGKPYIITEVPTGRHTVVVKRSDGVQFRDTIEVVGGEKGVQVTFEIPKTGAAIIGRCIRSFDSNLYLWKSDETLVTRIAPDNDGDYIIENLPAGDYMIINYYLGRSNPLVSFSLSEGETEMIDIDSSDWSAYHVGTLHTQVIGADNLPLTQAVVWLDGPLGEVSAFKETGQGQYFFTEPGRYMLNVICPGYARFTAEVFLEERDTMAGAWSDGTTLIRLEK